ncbi:MAG: polyprenyl synthetase family protein [Planctomycetia bacterium]
MSRETRAVIPQTGDAGLPDVRTAIDRVRAFIDPRLEQAVAGSADSAPRLQAALRYALLAPGKRLRPALVLWAAQACGGDWDTAAPAAAAVEMIHAYSLVHDDLPAMDDDDLRRGIPTCHRAFDEATAILCGDALQSLAFETLAAGLPGAVAGRGCLVLARAAGADALVGGQADDLAVERGWATDVVAADAAGQVAWMERIHRRKTAALILAALELGGLAAGADAERLRMLAAYGRAFGLAFQIADDLLDAAGDEAAVGKRVGKDAGRGKLTYPTVLGAAESRRLADELADEAATTVAGLGHPAAELVALARWVVARDH